MSSSTPAATLSSPALAKNSPKFPVSSSRIPASLSRSKATPTASAATISINSSPSAAPIPSAIFLPSRVSPLLPSPRTASAKRSPSPPTTLPKAASATAASNSSSTVTPSATPPWPPPLLQPSRKLIALTCFCRDGLPRPSAPSAATPFVLVVAAFVNSKSPVTSHQSRPQVPNCPASPSLLASPLPPQVMRSSGRIPKQIPILLIGSDLDGRVFSEHTSTVLLSLHGAGILSRHKLSPEQELVLRWPEKNRETEIRVVGHLGEQSGKHTYGVAFFDENLNFWEIDFPPVSSSEMELGVLALVCIICNTLEKIDDSSVEADVCASNESVLRSCKRCGTATLWKPALSVIPQQAASPDDTQLPLFSAPSTPAPSPAPPSISAPALQPSPTPPPVPPPAPPSFYAQSYSSVPDHLSPSESPAAPSSAVSSEDRSEPGAPVSGSQ